MKTKLAALAFITVTLSSCGVPFTVSFSGSDPLDGVGPARTARDYQEEHIGKITSNPARHARP